MASISNVLDGYVAQANADDLPITIGGWVLERIKRLFTGLNSYDTGAGINDETGGFRYVGKYEGKPVYAGSNEAIGRLLDRYGESGHRSKTINYGAAFNGSIYVIDQLVDGAGDAGRADPLSSLKLKYVLDHELAHLEGAGERKAHEHARKTTGLTIANIGGFI